MKRILVPLDGSDFAEGALSTAVALAMRDGAKLQLLCVVPTEPPFGFTDEAMQVGWVDEVKALQQDYMKQMAARVAARSEDLRVEASVSVGNVGATIREVSDTLDADLVILTTHGRGAFGRVWLGSTADQLLRCLERPVLLLPPTPAGEKPFAEDPVRQVLVPLDGSQAAEAALDALPLLLSASGDLKLTLASVVEDFSVPSGYPQHATATGLVEEERKRMTAYLAAVSQRVEHKGMGVPETHVLVADSAARGLLRFCRRTEVDAIALSTHGRGGVSRLLLGSVADKLIRGAGIPVLVVRRRVRASTEDAPDSTAFGT